MNQYQIPPKLLEETLKASYGKEDGTGGYKSWLNGNTNANDTYYPKLWEWLQIAIQPKAVLDVGCAEGRCVKWWNDLGVTVLGIEGAIEAVRASPVRGRLRYHNIEHSAFKWDTVPDLVWCCEVVEHIRPQFLSNLLYTITQHGAAKTVAITHAVPGQGGYHHVNCQPSRYWVQAIEERGYKLSDGDTKLAREVAHSYFKKTGLIFHRK